MIYPYISFLNNHFSNIFAIFAFNETSKIVKQDHAQETTQVSLFPLFLDAAESLVRYCKEAWLQQDCPRAEKCLHQIAYRPLIEQPATVLRLLNPTLCTRDGACPYFRDSAPVTYARGFTGMQSRMFPAQYQQFMSILMSHFGRNPYFERRRGEFPLSPKEQRIVLNALRRVGVTEELRFDHYEESVNWYD